MLEGGGGAEGSVSLEADESSWKQQEAQYLFVLNSDDEKNASKGE